MNLSPTATSALLLRLDLLRRRLLIVILAFFTHVGNGDADDHAVEDAPDEVGPEGVDQLQGEDGRKDLVPVAPLFVSASHLLSPPLLSIERGTHFIQ